MLIILLVLYIIFVFYFSFRLASTIIEINNVARYYNTLKVFGPDHIYTLCIRDEMWRSKRFKKLSDKMDDLYNKTKTLEKVSGVRIE